MNAFALCRGVEDKSRQILMPFIQERADDGRYVITDKGNLSRMLQEQCGDVLFNDRNDVLISVELKAEERHTGNLFLETWSNRNLENKVSHSARGSNPGWMVKSRADYLFYHFLDGGQLYIIPLFELQVWAWTSGEFFKWPERRQGKHVQLNDTWGRCVPWKVLHQAVPAMRRVFPLQFELLPELSA
jgi:hypothetical protein